MNSGWRLSLRLIRLLRLRVWPGAKQQVSNQPRRRLGRWDSSARVYYASVTIAVPSICVTVDLCEWAWKTEKRGRESRGENSRVAQWQREMLWRAHVLFRYLPPRAANGAEPEYRTRSRKRTLPSKRTGPTLLFTARPKRASAWALHSPPKSFLYFPLTCISLFSLPPPPKLPSHPLLLKFIRGRQTVSRAAVPKGASVFFKNLVFIHHNCLGGPGGPEWHWQKRGCQGRPAKMPAPWTVQSRGGQTDGYLNRPSSSVVFGPLGTSPWTSTSNYVFIFTNTHWSVLLSVTL